MVAYGDRSERRFHIGKAGRWPALQCTFACSRAWGSDLGRPALWGDVVSNEIEIGMFLDTRGLTQEMCGVRTK